MKMECCGNARRGRPTNQGDIAFRRRAYARRTAYFGNVPMARALLDVAGAGQKAVGNRA